jgi:hypothetical protein
MHKDPNIPRGTAALNKTQPLASFSHLCEPPNEARVSAQRGNTGSV